MTQRHPQATLADNEFQIQAFGRLWRLGREFDLEKLWAQMDSLEDDRIPYWTELWPASLALAEWLFCVKDRISSATCLDLGCGLGFTAMIGQWLGARVIACDYEPESLAQACANFARNGVEQPAWICLDWRMPALAPGCADFIWGGDLIYERRACQPILDLIGTGLAPGGCAWLADPDRGIFRYFMDLAVEKGFKIRGVHRMEAGAVRPQEARIPVTIWEISRNG